MSSIIIRDCEEREHQFVSWTLGITKQTQTVLKHGALAAVLATSGMSGIAIPINSSKKLQTTRRVPLESCGL